MEDGVEHAILRQILAFTVLQDVERVNFDPCASEDADEPVILRAR